ncbi:MAG: BamA/TamA family outer membrane protein [bacterium]
MKKFSILASFAFIAFGIIQGYALSQGKEIVAKVTILGNRSLMSDVIIDAITLKEGEPFSQADLERSVEEIRKLGYFSDVTGEKRDIAISEVEVIFTVKEYPVIEEVALGGNYGIKEPIYREKIPFKPGDVLNKKKLYKSEDDLMALPYVEEVTTELRDGRDVGKKILVYNIKERPSISPIVGIFPTVFYGALGGNVALHSSGDRNPFASIGGAQLGISLDNYKIGGSYNYIRSYLFYLSRAPVLYSGVTSQRMPLGSGDDPYIEDFKQSSDPFATGIPIDLPRYNEQRFGLKTKWSVAINQNSFVDLYHRIEDIKLWSGRGLDLRREVRPTVAIGSADSDGGFVHSVGMGLSQDTRDDPVDPVEGWRGEVVVETTDKFLGSESGFTRYTFDTRNFIPLGGEGHAFAIRLAGGIGAGLPFYEKFTAGGPSSLRAYPVDRFRGDILFLSNWEYRFLMYRFNEMFALEGALFIDAGRAWYWWGKNQSENKRIFGPENLSFPNDMLNRISGGGGLGVKLTLFGSPYILRLDYAGGDESTGIAGGMLNLGLGHPF